MKLTHSFIKQQARLGLNFFRYLLARMNHDRVNVNHRLSGLYHLTVYGTHVDGLAVDPLFLCSFANAGEVIQDFVITHFVPAAGEVVKTALIEFVANTGKMTAVGGAFCLLPPSC